MTKRRVPNIVRGGTAVPLGRNYYYMSGRKHEQGGIDIGRNPRTGLEVEDGEVMHIGRNEIKVFSAQPFLNGKSPAQRVMSGDNPDNVFNAQERYKKRNKLNDDGTKKKRTGGQISKRKYITTLTAVEEKQFQNWYSKIAKHKNLNPNPDADGQDYDYRGYWKNEDRDEILGSNPNVHFTDKYKQPSHPTFSNESKYSSKETPGGEWVKGKGTWLFKHNKFTARQADRTADYLNGTGEGFILGTDTIIPNRKKRMGGLSRDKDYGSKSKPYPNVNSRDFAGKERSYPIPTKADARDALRLAGLHGRNDVKAKVYAKYPDFRRKARNGGLYSITVNGKTTLKPFPKRKKAALGTDDEYNNRNFNNYGYVIGPMNWSKDVASTDIAGNVLRWTLPSGNSNNYPQLNEFIDNDSSKGKSTSGASGANKVNTSAALARRGTPVKRTYSGIDIPDNGHLDIIGIDTITPNIAPNITPSSDNIDIQPVDLNISNNRRFGNRIRSFFRNNFNGNNIPTLIGGLANFIGNNRSYKANKKFINSLRYADSPIQIYAPKLKTRINIAPQLDAMRESLANYERNINNNTASSQVALARNRAARLNNILLANNIYASKENKETELINNDRINRGNTTAKNIESYNNYQNGLAAFRNSVAEKNAENEVSRISNNIANIQNIINSLSQNRNFGNTLIAQMATAPNVNPEYLRALGADWITDEMIRNYKKANRKN